MAPGIPEHVRPPLKIDRAKAKAAFRENLPDAVDQEIDDALAGIDQDATFDEERARFAVQEWDKQSPINGVPAERVLERRGHEIPPGGRVYLIRDAESGRVVYFQPHKPGVSGLQPIVDPLTEGALHADEVAANRTAVQVLAAVRQRILAARLQ